MPLDETDNTGGILLREKDCEVAWNILDLQLFLEYQDKNFKQ